MSAKDERLRDRFDASVPAFTLQRAPNPLGHGRLAIARSLGRLGIPVYSTHAGRWTPTAVSRFSSGGFTHPPQASEELWVENLCRYGRKLGDRPVLVPIGDDDVFFVDRNQDALGEAFRFQRQPPGVVRATADKREMNALCRKLGIPTPGAGFPDDQDEACRLAREIGFPIVLKQIDASLRGRVDGLRVMIVADEQGLREAHRDMESSERPNVMVQEYIPGPSESVWMMNAYFGADSECFLPVTGRKVRQDPPERGVTTLGVCVHNEAVERATRELAKAIGYRGIIDIGWRFDARDGSYKMLDLNPRLGATFRLFVGADGMDVVRALHLDLTGRPIPADRAVEGRKWMTELHDSRTSLILARRGELTAAGWLRSLSGVAETAWLAADDPLPAGSLALFAARRLAARSRTS